MNHPSTTIHHPAPERRKENRYLLALNLFGVPACWVAQMMLCEILSSYACYPHRMPLAEPIWAHLYSILIVINALCFVAAICLLGLAYVSLRRIHHDFSHHHVIEVGEGRAKFLAILSILFSILFLIAIGFTACAVLVVRPCGG